MVEVMVEALQPLEALEEGARGKVVFGSGLEEIPISQVDVCKLDPQGGFPLIWPLTPKEDTLRCNTVIEIMSVDIHCQDSNGVIQGPGICIVTEDYSLLFIKQEHLSGIKGLLPI